MRLRTVVALFALLLLAYPAAAQEQRGSIEGTVKDTSGAVLPGVTVTVTNGQGITVTAVSDAQGVYRFPSLLPGTYTVSAELQGFQPGKTPNVIVQLGQIKKVDFGLSVGGVSENVQVTAESPLVDVKQSTRATDITAERVSLLPHDNNFTSLVTQAPGASEEAKSGGIMIDGSSAAENRYVIDGMETTDIIHGQSQKNLLTDFVDEVQVKSSGYPAEYGGSTGGVINVITKSGTNNFSGTALTYFQGSSTEGAANKSLRYNPTDASIAEYHTYPNDDNTRFEPGGSLGGPIFRNRAWFYGAYQPALTRIDRTVNAETSGIAKATPSNTIQHQKVQYLLADETMQFGDKLRTRIAYNNSWSQTKGQLARTTGSDKPGTDYTKGTNFPNWTLSGQADYVVTPKFLIGVRAGRFLYDTHDFNVIDQAQFNFSNGTSNIGMPGVPESEQHQGGFASIPSNSATKYDTRTRNFAQVDATYYGHFAGDHQIKGGVQIDRRAENINTGNLENIVNIRWGLSYKGQSGPFGYYELRSNAPFPRQGIITQGKVQSNVTGIFLQDQWSVNDKLTVNGGVRTESENVPAYATGPGVAANPIDFSMADKIAPRAGFAYDIKGDGRWKAYGSWGVFYDIFKLELPQGSFGGQKWISYYYTLDTPNFETVRDSPDCPPACSGTQIGNSVDFRAVSVTPGVNIEPNIKPMRSQEVTFGLEHQLGPVTAVSARYIHKQLNRGIEDVGDLGPDGEAYIIANPGEGIVQQFDISTGTSLYAPQGGTDLTQTLPKPKRNYDAVELDFTKRLANNWSFYGSYTWSRDWGNYPGLSESDENGRSDPNVGRSYDYPAELFNGQGQPNYGVLPTDRTNAVKLSALYQFAWGTSVGVNTFIESGTPVNRQVPIISPDNYPVYYLGRGSDGRLPMLSRTDLYVQHSFRVGGTRSVTLSANVLNLFNQRTPINRVDTMANGGGLPNAPGFYQEGAFYAGQLNFDQLIAAAEASGDLTPNSEFLMNNDFQDPIQARFGIKFSF
ncbi:MAG TPA: TonB-dependent receptor [Vicinamibacterales bacterium]|nr:TonB-dependent receptor [Vicinamibacterales bacterium]